MVDWRFQTLTCNTKGMRNGKCKGMNGGRHLPEAHAGLSAVCCSSPPSHPLIKGGREREMYRAPVEERRWANRNVTPQGPPTLLLSPLRKAPERLNFAEITRHCQTLHLKDPPRFTQTKFLNYHFP